MRAKFVLRVSILLLVGILAAAPDLRADGLQDCAHMLRLTGPVNYRGTAPEHSALCRIGYVLSFNTETLVPDWVLEDLTPDRLDGSAERSQFHPDDDLPDEQRVSPKDYTGANLDRGHMAPAGDMKWNVDAMEQSFLMSNMAPQVGIGLNRNIWARLEDSTRNWAKERGRVIVITGPVFGDNPRHIGSAHKVAVPEAFYKIVYDPAHQRAIGFLLPNKDLTGRKVDEFIVPILQIEERTGLSFLSKLPARTKNILLKTKSPMWREVN